jgi:hypothetical protein
MFRLILVPFNRDSGEFEDQEFNKFCREHSVIRIEKEFVHTEANIFYSFFIEYQDKRERSGRPDLDSLSDTEKAQYEKLRDWRHETAEWMSNCEKHLLELQTELREQRYQAQQYKYFILREPKERVISGAAFRDRVVHHALVNVIEPCFERAFIHDSYATRIDKGLHLAVKAA